MLKDNLPPFLLDIAEITEVLEAEQPEIDALDTGREEMRMGFYVNTINERTVDYWEDFLGFERAPAWSMDRRRERIAARLISTSPVTVAVLKETIERTGDCTVQITENSDMTVTVTFTSVYGVPTYLEDIQEEVEKIRPFHIPVLYEFTYVYLGIYAAYTLGSLAAYTLDQLSLGDPLE